MPVPARNYPKVRSGKEGYLGLSLTCIELTHLCYILTPLVYFMNANATFINLCMELFLSTRINLKNKVLAMKSS